MIATNGTRGEYISNGHYNGNGHAPEQSPAQKAWQTAKDRAVNDALQDRDREQSDFERQLDAELRALVDRNLSNGAARLFNLLCKLGWKKKLGGKYNDQLGRILIDARQLAKLCGGSSKNCLYPKHRPEKRDSHGKLVRADSVTEGWINELVRGGYIWLSKHRVANIPPSNWPNVYNVSCHAPQHITPHLPWSDGNWGGEVVIADELSPNGGQGLDGQARLSRNGGQDFAALNTAGDTETAQIGTGTHRNGTLPVQSGGDMQAPHGQPAKHRNGGQPVPSGRDTQAPQRGTGKHRNGGQPSTVTEDGQDSHGLHLRETRDLIRPSDSENGGEPPDFSDVVKPELEKWIRAKRLAEMFDSKREKLLATLLADLSTLRTDPKKRERTLSSDAKRDVDFAETKATLLGQDGKVQEAQKWANRSAAILNDPRNYSPGPLFPMCAQEEALLVAKVAAVKKCLKEGEAA